MGSFIVIGVMVGIAVVAWMKWRSSYNRQRPTRKEKTVEQIFREQGLVTAPALPPRAAEPEPKRTSAEDATFSQFHARHQPGGDRSEYVFFRDLYNDLQRVEYDQMRLTLQRIAYSMVGPDVPQAQKDEFKRLQTAFAKIDPQYREVLSVALPLIKDSPGILQSDLTKKLMFYEPETVRYVLYFAHEIGDVYRVKKGRSYALFPEPTTIDVAPVKKRARIKAS